MVWTCLKSLENYLSVALKGLILSLRKTVPNATPDGSFVQVNTGEIRGIVVAIHSSIQHETLFFTIADMAQSEIEDLGIKYREEVELEDIVITHTHVNRNDIYKLFASKIKKRMEGHLSRKTNL